MDRSSWGIANERTGRPAGGQELIEQGASRQGSWEEVEDWCSILYEQHLDIDFLLHLHI